MGLGHRERRSTSGFLSGRLILGKAESDRPRGETGCLQGATQYLTLSGVGGAEARVIALRHGEISSPRMLKRRGGADVQEVVDNCDALRQLGGSAQVPEAPAGDCERLPGPVRRGGGDEHRRWAERDDVMTW
jgi:hypothetical protein